MSAFDRYDAELIDETLLRIRRHCEANAGRLNHQELECLADIILRVAGGNPEYPSRCDLEHHGRRVYSLDDESDPVARRAHARPAVGQATGPSLQALIARLLVAANLGSRGQREVARLYLFGHSTVEIAHALSIPRTTVQSRWRRARERLQEALREVPLADWITLPTASASLSSEAVRVTFDEQQHTPRYHAPQHCPAGKERCARTGICPLRGAAVE